MSVESDYAVLDRAEARAELLTVFDDARDPGAMEEILARFAPHELERRLEIIDQQAGMVGVSNGRISRSEYGDSHTAHSEKRQRDRQAAADMTAHQLAMMNDPAYREAFERLEKTVSQYEEATEQAIARLERELADHRMRLETMLANAPRLEDGRRVFRDENGAVWDEDLRRVSDDEAAHIEWTGREASVGDYKAELETGAEIESTLLEARRLQVDLGEARERMGDESRETTAEEWRELEANIQRRVSELSGIPELSEAPTVLDAVGTAPVAPSEPIAIPDFGVGG